MIRVLPSSCGIDHFDEHILLYAFLSKKLMDMLHPHVSPMPVTVLLVPFQYLIFEFDKVCQTEYKHGGASKSSSYL
jgi:hypothetical protein